MPRDLYANGIRVARLFYWKEEYMVIDFHTHAFPDAIAPRAIASLVEGSKGIYPPCTDGTVKGLTENMDRFGVDLSVVQPVITKPSQLGSLNRWAQELQNERLISFGGFHPHTDDYKRDLKFLSDMGFRGIKLHPEYQHFTVNDPEMLKIYDYALSLGFILMFHAGFDPAFPPPFHSTPKMFAEISKELRGGMIVAAHMGGAQQLDDVERDLCGADVYLDTSMGFEHYTKDQFLRIVRAHGVNKILFGSDSPWSRASEEISAIRSLDLPDSEKELILHGNAERILGL